MNPDQEAGGETRQVDADEPSGKQSHTRSRNERLSFLVVLVVLIAVIVAVNWPYQYQATTTRDSSQVTSPVDFQLLAPSMPVMGGWPYRYLIRYPNAAQAESIHRFSLAALIYDLILAALVSAAFLVYVWRRNRRSGAGKSKLSIADLLLLTLILAALFGWWQHIGRQHQQQLDFGAALRSEGASYATAAWVPAVLESRLPAEMKSKFSRVRHVRIEYPTDEIMDRLVDYPHLSTLRVGGGEYDLRLLDRLSKNPHLEDLRIAGRVMDAPALQSIVSHKRLHTLNLMRTNVSVEALQLLGELPNLQRLSLIHSDADLSQLGTPPWSRTIRELHLPHPDPGDEARVQIAGWPELELLKINEFDSQLNSTAMSVELADLPALTGLQLDVFQKFDLKLRNLPKLAKIESLDFQWQGRLPRGGSLPGSIWCGRLDVDGLAELEKLHFFCLGLKSFRVRNAPKLDFAGVGAFYKTNLAASYAPKLEPEAAKALIDGLGESEGPALIDLDAVPLSDIDLAPLAGNRGITELLLSQSGTELKQWKALKPMTWLTRLHVKDCPIDDAGVKWILESFPNLEHFAFTPNPGWNYGGAAAGVSQLDIVDKPNLKSLDMGSDATSFFQKLRIVNAPNLQIPLKLGYVRQLEINKAPLLTGLAVHNPLPPGAKLEGVRDLQFLAVGGPSVTDEFIAPLAECKSLSLITLAYPAVTADGLRKLTNMGRVTSLNLPGCPVDDSIVAAWPKIEYLTELDLSDTAVTGASVKRLLSSQAASRVALDRTGVDKSDLQILSENPSLTQLSLSGVGIEADTLGEILAAGRLERLDLSDTELTVEVLDALVADGGSLAYLFLRNCRMDFKKLAELASSQPGIKIDVTGCDVPTRLMTSLVSARRLVDREELAEELAMQKMMSAASMGGSFQQLEPEYPGMINTRSFAQLAQQPSDSANFQPGQPMATGTTPSPAVGTQVGRWLGGILFGGQNSLPAADPDGVESDPDEVTLPPEETTETDTDPIMDQPDRASPEPAGPPDEGPSDEGPSDDKESG